METLQLSGLPNFNVGGAIHLVQQSGWSTKGCNVARIIQAPVFHVDASDRMALYRALRIAFDYRKAFEKDVVISLLNASIDNAASIINTASTLPMTNKQSAPLRTTGFDVSRLKEIAVSSVQTPPTLVRTSAIIVPRCYLNCAR